MTSSVYSLLDRKRDGDTWRAEELRSFIDGFMEGEVADYQMSAFLMAAAIHGLDEEESQALTRAMLESGEEWKLGEELPFVADKHSTGGVGDKISLVMAPWLASCGVPIAMLSGRGLGHTGGTLDKLESIPGFRAGLTRDEILRSLETVGCAIATSTEQIAPADRRLYALRDVTGTVRSIPLITASIMSKKLAMGASALVLDVKVGRGAFMHEIDEARTLARSLISAAVGTGTRVSALISDMNQPLGYATGNANEVAEAMAVLRGEGPDDVRELSRDLAITLMEMKGEHREEAARRLDAAIESGAAIETAARWIDSQGGDPSVTISTKSLPQPSEVVEISANHSGFVSGVDPMALAELAVSLGAGRRVQSDRVDHAAGVTLTVSPGDEVSEGEVVARVELGERMREADELQRIVTDAISIEDSPPTERSIVMERVDATIESGQ